MAQVCLIDSQNIVNGSNLMKNNTNLVKWNSSLEKLKTADYMFSGCTALS
jgi:hypothetical protein